MPRYSQQGCGATSKLRLFGSSWSRPPLSSPCCVCRVPIVGKNKNITLVSAACKLWRRVSAHRHASCFRPRPRLTGWGGTRIFFPARSQVSRCRHTQGCPHSLLGVGGRWPARSSPGHGAPRWAAREASRRARAGRQKMPAPSSAASALASPLLHTTAPSGEPAPAPAAEER